MDSDDPILVPFGPTRPIPPGHRHCFACDGSGIDETDDDGRACKVCDGKGYHNAEDIRRYHERHPDVCRASCGERHLVIEVDEPRGDTSRDIIAEADALLEKYRHLIKR